MPKVKVSPWWAAVKTAVRRNVQRVVPPLKGQEDPEQVLEDVPDLQRAEDL